jgi:hypothetical protein
LAQRHPNLLVLFLTRKKSKQKLDNTRQKLRIKLKLMQRKGHLRRVGGHDPTAAGAAQGGSETVQDLCHPKEGHLLLVPGVDWHVQNGY